MTFHIVKLHSYAVNSKFTFSVERKGGSSQCLLNAGSTSSLHVVISHKNVSLIYEQTLNVSEDALRQSFQQTVHCPSGTLVVSFSHHKCQETGSDYLTS